MKDLFKFLRRNAGLIALTVVVAYFVFLWVYSSGSVEGLENDNDVLGQTFVWAQIVLNGANGVKIDQEKEGSNLTVGTKVSDDEWIEQGFKSDFLLWIQQSFQKPTNDIDIEVTRPELTKKDYDSMKTNGQMAIFTEELSRLSAISNSGTGQTMDGYLALANPEINKTYKYINGVDISNMVTSDKVEDIEAKAAKEAESSETPAE
jgi:hypothetical protein